MIAYIIIIVTFILLGILSFLKQIREGLLASLIGAGATALIGIVHFIITRVGSFFGKYAITMLDFFSWILFIAIAIILFVVLCFVIKLNNGGKGKKGSNKKFKK